MLKAIARWFGIGETEAERKRRERQRAVRREVQREAEGRESFYPMRDEAIRVARAAETAAVIDALAIAEEDARKKQGTADYQGALGVVAGFQQVLRERKVRRIQAPEMSLGQALAELGLEGDETANEVAHVYGARARRAAAGAKARLDEAYRVVMAAKGATR